ncbi:uncharacterized protein BX664DRAFT_122712 [Halteromyces radiatus]|uniref:uncharacterized protein n=1 Tax=Halteromyces radiatus TaxID=101107 RepID=UPI00221FA964|nr:uncharacterized protein BX664DRAFT_122712 [Halteromyces radiatus]KAI8088862.1 hypothetical protein BX664DRAFT_122712 [Halteromyces radiatus]
MTKGIEWVYAIGSSWNRCDPNTQRAIEKLWANDAAGWIKSPSFGDYVYVDTTELSLTYGTYSYTIARRCC